MAGITEPATLVTDYLLAVFTAALAYRLWAAGGSTTTWWAAAFAATAVAGAAGGTVHGFRTMLAPATTAALWLLTLEAIVFAGLAVVLATIQTFALTRRARARVTAIACIAFLGYAIWLPNRPQFVYAMVGYGSALLILTVVQLIAWMSTRSRASAWLLGGVAVSIVAAVIQRSGWALHRHFNHNDLFHVVQALAVWLLYRGASAVNSQIPTSNSQMPISNSQSNPF